MGFQLLFLKRKPTSLPEPTEPVATMIGGRRHRTDIPYLMPKDLPEDGRLEYQHFFLKAVLGKNYFAPLENPVNILDVGCGTGRWCIEVAQEFPSTWVTGVDIEFHLPPVSIPTNCHFIQGNVLQRLPFSDQFFSYAHQRFLSSAIPLAYWPDAIAELKRVTRTGGYVELFEGGTVFTNAGEHTRRFLSWWQELSFKRGIETGKVTFIGIWLKRAGLRHVSTQTIQAPIGAWGGRAGVGLQNMCLTGWAGCKELVCGQLGVHPDVFDGTLAQLPYEWSYHRSCYEYYSAYGQR